MTRTTLIAAGLSVLVVCSSASAQISAPGEPDVSQANVRFGPLSLKPTIGLTNLGIDTNVFNESDRSAPKRDFTFTVTPQTDLWLRMGRSWVTGNIKSDLVWYETFASERSANNTARIGWFVPLNAVSFNAGAAYLRTRARPGYEIDARSQRNELGYDGGLKIRVRPKTFVGVHADRTSTTFDSIATFDGVNLREALSRTITSVAVTLRQQLTPYTALTLDVGRDGNRFEYSPIRDSDSSRVAVGITLDRFALIKGSASFGYRDFRPRSSSLPPYTGTTATADLSYVAFGRLRAAVQAIRDVQYSFDINQPYYLLNGATASLTARIALPLDVVGRIGKQRLDYRDRIGVVIQAPDRMDHVTTFGGGYGYHIGNDVRIGFDVDEQHRTSVVGDREYHGLTFGTSVTYGF